MANNNYWATFNGIQLTSVPGLSIYSINDAPPQKTLNIYNLARANVDKLTSSFYHNRVVSISVNIVRPTRELHDQSLDQLLAILMGNEGTLVIPRNGGARQYTVTFLGHSVNTDNTGRSRFSAPKGGFGDLTLDFRASDSYGYDTTYSLITNQTGLTSGNLTIPYTQGGTAEFQVPVIQVKYTGSSPNTGTVTIGNQNTGAAISITATFNQYDILTIDCQAKTVQINGADVTFTGAFPETNNSTTNGLQTLYYLDTFSSRTFNLYAYVYNRYV